MKTGALIHIKIYTKESAELKNLEHPNSYVEISEQEFLNFLSVDFNQVYFNPNIKTGFKSNNKDLSSMVYVGVVK